MCSEGHAIHVEDNSHGEQGFQVGPDAALGFSITIQVAVLGVKYQLGPVSPFKANPAAMLVFMGSLSVYITSLIAVVMWRSRTRGHRGLAVALLFRHLSFISGLFASASLLFLLVPASFWWILMASSSVVLLIAAPCEPINLFYSKIRHQSSPQAFNISSASHNRPSEEADANIPDLEKNLHALSDVHDSKDEGDCPNSIPKGTAAGELN